MHPAAASYLPPFSSPFLKGVAVEARPEPRLVPGADEAARVPLVAQERELHGPRLPRRRRRQQQQQQR